MKRKQLILKGKMMNIEELRKDPVKFCKMFLHRGLNPFTIEIIERLSIPRGPVIPLPRDLRRQRTPATDCIIILDEFADIERKEDE